MNTPVSNVSMSGTLIALDISASAVLTFPPARAGKNTVVTDCQNVETHG